MEALNADFIKRYESGDLLRATDGRTAVGKAIRGMRQSLVQHVGTPSVVQNRVIDETCFLSIVIGCLQGQYLDGAINKGAVVPSGRFSSLYRPWSTLLFRNLQSLGFKKPEKKALDLKSYLDGWEAQQERDSGGEGV
jgi:hypothetical protein